MTANDTTATISQEPAGQKYPVLFYDGECGFCARSVRFVLRHEHAPVLMFAPLQGETAAEALDNSGLPSDIGKSTIVLMDDGKYLIRSRAAFRVMRYMGGGWKPLSVVLSLIPTALTDLGYRLMARSRGMLPGINACALPQPEQRKRFLD